MHHFHVSLLLKERLIYGLTMENLKYFIFK